MVKEAIPWNLMNLSMLGIRVRARMKVSGIRFFFHCCICNYFYGWSCKWGTNLNYASSYTMGLFDSLHLFPSLCLYAIWQSSCHAGLVDSLYCMCVCLCACMLYHDQAIMCVLSTACIVCVSVFVPVCCMTIKLSSGSCRQLILYVCLSCACMLYMTFKLLCGSCWQPVLCVSVFVLVCCMTIKLSCKLYRQLSICILWVTYCAGLVSLCVYLCLFVHESFDGK